MIDDDAELMLAFKAGDRGAFETLFERYTPRLLNFLTRMVRDRDRAEELTQDVFVRVYTAAPRYEMRAKFSTWVFGIAHNLALNDLDRAYRKRERSPEPGELSDPRDPDPDPHERVAARQLAEALESALSKLPERQRSAILLRSEQGLGYQEISEVLGTSVSGVKSLLHRARESLLSELKEIPE
ncbi:MAG: RNA polymerase sigma factor [Myxococcota bacterium]